MLLSGYRLNENKRILDSLQKIFGIGGNKAEQIVCLLGVTKNICLWNINYLQQLQLDRIMVHYVHGFRAKRVKSDRISFLHGNKSYRGVRHNYFYSFVVNAQELMHGHKKIKKLKK